jgi:hypothetical protein
MNDEVRGIVTAYFNMVFSIASVVRDVADDFSVDINVETSLDLAMACVDNKLTFQGPKTNEAEGETE